MIKDQINSLLSELKEVKYSYNIKIKKLKKLTKKLLTKQHSQDLETLTTLLYSLKSIQSVNKNNPLSKEIYELIILITEYIETKGKLDALHEMKRSKSFDFFSEFLNSCYNSQNCPNITIDHHSFLIDISLKGYMSEWGHYNNEESKDKNFTAEKLINKVLECKKKPTMSQDIFLFNSQNIRQESIDGVRRRKAFWNYMSGRYNNHEKDYYSACSLIDKLHFNNKTNNLKQFIQNNMDTINAVELYSFCFSRNMIYL